ncbi:hypothetical protein [Helicobacter canis]|uniref:hypothetical protein n=1 Tax=Helicobacter canis TaxID=29419 RepID=UPI0011CBBC21|nr:hypothetical protein [Helicobacter canis]
MLKKSCNQSHCLPKAQSPQPKSNATQASRGRIWVIKMGLCKASQGSYLEVMTAGSPQQSPFLAPKPTRVAPPTIPEAKILSRY